MYIDLNNKYLKELLEGDYYNNETMFYLQKYVKKAIKHNLPSIITSEYSKVSPEFDYLVNRKILLY